MRRLALALSVPIAAAGLAVLPTPAAVAQVTVPTVAREVSAPVGRTATLTLPVAATHVALHWRGSPEAAVTVQFSADGRAYGAARDAGRDEAGEVRGNGETYGAVLVAGTAARFARVTTDRPIARLTALAMRDGAPVTRRVAGERAAAAEVSAPTVVSRAQWGADESLRTWQPAFHPVQKLIVHHTAGANDDPDPQATIRAIYRYHAVTQGWGDIGYNVLVDETGRVYEGRYSRTYAAGETPTGEDLRGYGVTAAHTSGANSGTFGVALLGTLTSRDATAAARAGLEELLAWKADRHGLDPQATSTYTNPVDGSQRVVANISGHRDWLATECPGGAFYATLPALRAAVAARMAGTTPEPPPAADTTPPPTPTGVTATGVPRAIRLSWQPVSDPSGVSYDVYRATTKGFFARLTTRPTTSYDDPVGKGKTYRYYVVAVDGAGNRSGSSATVQATSR